MTTTDRIMDSPLHLLANEFSTALRQKNRNYERRRYVACEVVDSTTYDGGPIKPEQRKVILRHAASTMPDLMLTGTDKKLVSKANKVTFQFL